MTWVRDSDDAYDTEALWAADKDAALLWSVAMHECAKDDGDGVLTPKQIHVALTKFRTAIKRQAIDVLVAQGLWHDQDTLKRCPDCRDLSGGTLPSPEHRYIHDWKKYLLDERGKNDKLHRALDMARRALRTGRDREMAADVRRRDRDECQYCGLFTRWEDRKAGDKKSKDLGEFDHVDPFAEVLNVPANLVVSCKGCNSDKKQRTPAQWHAAGGRLLRRAPGSITDPTWVDPGSIPDPDGVIPDPPRVTRDSGPGPDQGGADPGSGHTDPDPNREPGPGRAGGLTDEQ